MRARVAVDFHLHFYQGYDPELFFRSLCRNLGAKPGVRHEDGIPFQRLALLTEAPGCDVFSLWAAPGAALPGGYVFAATSEPYSLALSRNDELLALIVKGRQIITAERLEVLTAGGFPALEDGLPLARVLEALTAAGVPAIIPWGAGKWLGRRGRLLRQLAAAPAPPRLYLADNPARPRFWPAPRAFRLLERQGRPVLRGSDPLPLPAEERRAGAFASWFEAEFDPRRPLASLVKFLDGNGGFRDLGRPDGLFTFLSRQLGLRLRAKE
jgi:hypothetical protein